MTMVILGIFSVILLFLIIYELWEMLRELETLEGENTTLRRENTTLKGKNKELENAKATFQKTLDEQKNQLRQMSAESNERIEQLNQQISNLSDGNLKRENDELNQRLNETANQVQQLTQELEKAVADNRENIDIYNKLEGEYKQACELNNALKDELTKEQRTAQELSDQLTSAKAEISSLKDAESNLDSQLQSSQKELQSSRNEIQDIQNRFDSTLKENLEAQLQPYRKWFPAELLPQLEKFGGDVLFAYLWLIFPDCPDANEKDFVLRLNLLDQAMNKTGNQAEVRKFLEKELNARLSKLTVVMNIPEGTQFDSELHFSMENGMSIVSVETSLLMRRADNSVVSKARVHTR